MKIPKDYNGPYLISSKVDGIDFTWMYSPQDDYPLLNYLKAPNALISIIEDGEWVEITDMNNENYEN